MLIVYGNNPNIVQADLNQYHIDIWYDNQDCAFLKYNIGFILLYGVEENQIYGVIFRERSTNIDDENIPNILRMIIPQIEYAGDDDGDPEWEDIDDDDIALCENVDVVAGDARANIIQILNQILDGTMCNGIDIIYCTEEQNHTFERQACAFEHVLKEMGRHAEIEE